MIVLRSIRALVSQAGHPGARQPDTHQPRAEVDHDRDAVLHGDDPAETVAVVSHLLAQGVHLDRRRRSGRERAVDDVTRGPAPLRHADSCLRDWWDAASPAPAAKA